MSTKIPKKLVLAVLIMAVVNNAGCNMYQGIYIGPLAIPIPVSPYFQDKLEDKAWMKERYGRAPILGPGVARIPPHQAGRGYDSIPARNAV